jgi:hypothetical protein
VVGDNGVSMVDRANRAVTVLFARCAAVLWWADGRRELVGEEGLSLTIMPADWEFSERLVRAIEKGVPAERFVPMSPLGKAGELTCQVCGRAPAVAVRLQCVTGMIVLYSIRSESQVLCRDCGIARFRQVSAESMLVGWWGLIAYFANLVVLVGNYLQRRRLARLHTPYGEPTAPPVSGGRRLWARPGAVLTAVVLAAPLSLIGAAIAGAVMGR